MQLLIFNEMILLCVVLILCTRGCWTDDRDMSKDDMDTYLNKYGYLGPNTTDSEIGEITDLAEAFKMAVMKFQKMAALPMTGKVDEMTMKRMQMPRCGINDLVTMRDVTATRRRKRFVTHGVKWRSPHLTYKIINYSPDFSQWEQKKEVKRAFDLWSSASQLTFREVQSSSSSRADIEISYGVRSHGDPFPFDGPRGTLGHAFFPDSGGDIHMDDDERFTAHDSEGINFFQALTHEIGHSLGLHHTDVWTAVMRPFAHPYKQDFKLDDDDIKGIQALYGQPAYATSPTTTTSTQKASTTTPTISTTKSSSESPAQPPVNPNEGTCMDGRFDAVTQIELADGRLQTLFLRRNMYYVYGTNDGDDIKYIAEGLPGIPRDLDAAFFIPKTNETYFFKGAKCWLYAKGGVVNGYPKNLSTEFPGIPSYVDCAFTRSGSNHFFFFKRDKYYKYNIEDKEIVDGHPLPLTNWQISDNTRIEAAFEWTDGRLYFFTGYLYYRYDDTEFQLEAGYPLPSRSWLGCDMETSVADNGASIASGFIFGVICLGFTLMMM